MHDIETNPEPRSPKFACGMCRKTVTSRQCGVACDNCNTWYHTRDCATGKQDAACVINHLKAMFARHLIPEELLTDNLPFSSREIVEFAKDWKLELTTSSPKFPQSNGQNERMVQVLKNILKKADYEGRYPYLALHAYRNTPVIGVKYSPARMSMSRVLR